MGTLRVFVTAFVLAGAIGVSAQQPPPIAGQWVGVVDTDQGTMDIEVTLRVADGKASGTIKTAHGELAIRDGAFIDNRWRLPFSGHGMKGEIVGSLKGETFEGIWDNSPTATGSVRLRRAK